jgi:uncharacterized protein (DUF1684 family)
MQKRLSTWLPLLFLAPLLAAVTAACVAQEEAPPDTAAAAPEAAPSVEVDPEVYAAEILVARQERDAEFSSPDWSPLAVVAIARLDRERTTIGSAESADLFLAGPDVEPLHAEILRSEAADGSLEFRLRAVGGALSTEEEPGVSVAEMDFAQGARARIGKYVVYSDNLGNFGAVVRALDFGSPAYTEFTGLEYFPPDPSYRILAHVTPFEAPEEIRMIDTRGWERPAWRYGEASLSLHGEEINLVLLTWVAEPRPGDQFFIAFTDSTSGEETYPACRYLNTDFVAEGPQLLDFNLATNPSCAYNDGFACPLPPRENRLEIPIRAGEKIYPHHQ